MGQCLKNIKHFGTMGHFGNFLLSTVTIHIVDLGFKYFCKDIEGQPKDGIQFVRKINSCTQVFNDEKLRTTI